MDLLGEYSSDEDRKSTPVSQHHDDGNAAMQKATTRGHVQLIDSTETGEVATDLFVREVPHTRGNWAGHVFVKIPSSFGRRARTSVTAFCSRLEEAGWTGTVLSHTPNLHLSLSRPFFLQQSSIESFVQSLQQRLSHERRTRLVVTGEKLLVNDSGTRSFWCWSLSKNASIQRILSHVDAVLIEYQQDTYYESPEFHVSLASLPGNVEELLRQYDTRQTDGSASVGSKSDDNDSDQDDSDGPLIVTIDHVCVTFGTTKFYRIDLKV